MRHLLFERERRLKRGYLKRSFTDALLIIILINI